MNNGELKQLLRNVVSISDDDYQRLCDNSPGVVRFFERIADVGRYRIVAEVVESRYCAAGIELGQKIVIEGGVVSAEKSTAPLCMRALGPLTGFVNTILERIVAGEDPNERVFMVAECLDPGIESGGLGKVKFKVTAQPK